MLTQYIGQRVLDGLATAGPDVLVLRRLLISPYLSSKEPPQPVTPYTGETQLRLADTCTPLSCT